MSGVNMNRVILTGNLTRPPELKTFESGTVIANLRIAVNGRIKRGETWEDKANYFDVTCFGRVAENVQKYMSKGSPVAIDGRLDFQEWENDAGEKRSKVVVIAENLQFLPGPQTGGGDGGPASTEAPVAATTPAANDDDDIPF